MSARTAGTRKAHNKTRLGCSQCKRRRIKCDGAHPTCFNCEKRGDQCGFLLLAPSTRLTAGSAPSVSTITSISPSSVPSPASSTSNSATGSLTRPKPLLPNNCYEVSVLESTAWHNAFTPSDTPFITPPSTPPPIMSLPDLTIPTTFPSISPYLRFNDLWRPTRDILPPALQGILYHYEYTTSLTLADADPAKAAWQSVVPDIAANHKFLVHNILAVASLHLARLHGRGEEGTAMINLAASQMNKAIQGFRPQLENINAENAAALFASATLTAVYFFFTATQEIENIRSCVLQGTIVPPPYVVTKMLAATLRTLWGLRGPWSVLMPGWDYVVKGRLSVIANRHWWPKDRRPKSDLALEEDIRLAEIENLWRSLNQSSDVDTLSSALFYLREAYALVSQLVAAESEYPFLTSVDYIYGDKGGRIVQMKDRGAIFVWATRISREFIKLLEQKNKYALVILAHYGVLAGRVRNVWWLEGMGANFIITVAMALGRENWHLIDWPVQVVGVDLENAFTARLDLLEGAAGEMAMEVV
ncbi:hypothetical protein P171DRAFT_429538 [Karstenula rhodostoma CBS 690.94]|uniref:Zn(2)-C6 fungal-type domain-containing protein n=1 Tax=Karstenula rhodostoma CBS 690.94 TaxID=1392251 RepID=A0A9P4UG64_9PLEO|nr:hypothetical protein P171DRAFT_429538 [Karstenula rhodostoma CBS 690.94]